MKKLYALALLFILGVAGISENVVVNVRKNTENSSDGSSVVNSGVKLGKGSAALKGNGDIKVQSRNVEDFSSVKISGAFNVVIVLGKAKKVTVRGDSNVLGKITTKTIGETLEIKSKGAYSVEKPIGIRLSSPDLKEIIFVGACTGNIEMKKESSLKLKITGACKIALSGKTKDLSVSLEGASNFNGLTAPAENVSVETSGASKAKVVSSGTLKVKASGASSVLYKGSPAKIEKDISIPAVLKKI